MRSHGDARGDRRDLQGAARGDRRVQGRRVRPRHRRDLRIGQGDAAIVPHVDVSLYVMTPEFGAASQLEKIDMLDFADFVAINKFDRKGAEDALRDVRKQYQRNRQLFSAKPDDMPVFGTMASRFNDDGVTALYQALCGEARRARPRARARQAAAGQAQGVDQQGGDRPAAARALPGRDRRDRARLQAPRRRAGAHRPRAPAARGASSRRCSPEARQGRSVRHDRLARRSAGTHDATRTARRRARRSSSPCGRTCRRPTRATNTW